MPLAVTDIDNAIDPQAGSQSLAVPFPITTNAFANWAGFERQFREWLAGDLDPDVVERVMQ